MSEMDTMAMMKPNWPALDVGIEFRLEVLLHARSEVGRVQRDRVQENITFRCSSSSWLGDHCHRRLSSVVLPLRVARSAEATRHH